MPVPCQMGAGCDKLLRTACQHCQYWEFQSCALLMAMGPLCIMWKCFTKHCRAHRRCRGCAHAERSTPDFWPARMPSRAHADMLRQT